MLCHVMQCLNFPALCFTLIVVLSVSAAVVSSVHADMYKYQDGSGAVCLTNTLDSVPKEYRKGMTVVREEAPKQEKLLPPLPAGKPARIEQVDLAESVGVPSTPMVQTGERYKHVKGGLILAAMIAGSFIVGRLAGAIGSPRLGNLLFLAILLAGGVYIYGMYIVELRSVFNGLRSDALNIKANVETREHKTERLLKEIPGQLKEEQREKEQDD